MNLERGLALTSKFDLPRYRRPIRRAPSRDKVVCQHYDWFPMQVVSGKETPAQIILEDRGFRTFVPRVAKWRNTNRYDRARQAKRLIEYAWLPGLLFLGMQWPYQWHRLMDVPHVLAIVSCTQDEPRPMAHAAIWRLMQRFGSGQFIAPSEQRWMETGHEFAEGDYVRFREGPMAEVTLKVVKISGRTATLFGQMFGADRGFSADVAQLRRFG